MTFCSRPGRSLAAKAVATAAAAACTALGSHAQTTSAAAPTTVTITGRSLPQAGVAGFGEQPLATAPLSAEVFSLQQLGDAGITTLQQITRLDASLGESYNADGYWASLSARGYGLDNRANYRRDGLPINAETAIALDNKERIELLKGASGIQAGSSAPGGLVNLIVKRPNLGNGSHQRITLQAQGRGSLLTAVDLGTRLGVEGRVGLRLNAAYEHLDPEVRNTEGHRKLLALAADWQLAPGSLLQAEVESSRQQQPSVAAFSMLGDTVPDPRTLDLRRNLNHQPWSAPVRFEGETASLRWQQQLGDDWRVVLHGLVQKLRTDDYTAFPMGDYDADYECTWCDRFASDGTFSYWEYISENERRDSRALQASVQGRLQTGAWRHQLEFGLLQTRYRARPQDQVYDLAGTGHVDGHLVTGPSWGTTDANTQRDERSTEWFLRDAITLGDWQIWAGLRHSRLDRRSVRSSPASDGLRATAYTQDVSTPWLAVALRVAAGTTAYASWGQGIETDVAPNRARYTNAGQPLPALKSRQFEAGVKHQQGPLAASVALFDIDRPHTSDIGICEEANTCTRQLDGSARHRGVEGSLAWDQGPWGLQASTMLLKAERRGAADASINGQRPVNVPQATLRVGAEYRPAAAPGLALLANLSAESDRVVLPYDSSVRIGGWSRLDLGLRWQHSLADATRLTWRLGLDNATDRKAWKESPNQFGHVYLYPLAPRTWRASVQVAL